MKSHFILFVMLLLISSMLFSQSVTHKVYLNNGSILSGKLIVNDSLKVGIETTGGNIWVFSTEEIDTIEKFKPTHQLLKNGYHNYTSIGALAGASGSKNNAPFVACMEHHYQFLNYFSAGILTGAELLNESVVPVSLNTKVFIPLNSVILFGEAYTGYSFSLEAPKDEYGISKAYGGMNAGCGLGLIFPLSSATGVFISLGYRYNELNYKRDDWYYGETDRTIYYNRLQVKIGVVLN